MADTITIELTREQARELKEAIRFAQMSTIDIVHCYECKYWQVGKMDLGLDCHTYPDHFCAEGERRSDD